MPIEILPPTFEAQRRALAVPAEHGLDVGQEPEEKEQDRRPRERSEGDRHRLDYTPSSRTASAW